MKLARLIAGVALCVSMGVFGSQKAAEACCGQIVDIWQSSVSPDIISPCDGEIIYFSGTVYEYYWADNLSAYPMGVTIAIVDEDSNTVRTIVADVTQTGGGGSAGVDDDGDGLTDEDPGYPTAGEDNDDDGRTDEDGGVTGDEYADFTFSAEWDGMDDGAAIVPAGMYTAAITAQAGDMGSMTLYATVVTTSEEPCCVAGGLVDITPDTINTQSNGKWVTGHVTPAPGYTADDVIAGTIVSIAGNPVSIPGEVKSPDDGMAVLKFDREAVADELPAVPEGPAGHGKPGRVEAVEICVEATNADSSVYCTVCDEVDVIQKGTRANKRGRTGFGQ